MFFSRLKELRCENFAAAKYLYHLNEKQGEQVFKYKWLEKGVPVHGHSTSNAQESMNGVLRRARYQAPYRFNNKVLEWIGEKIHERSEIARECIDCALTPYCKGLWEEQVPIEWLDVRDS